MRLHVFLLVAVAAAAPLIEVIIKECNDLWVKDITFATCIVLALLPPLYEHFSHTYTSGIRHVNRSYL
jgi:hypothetical protein